MRVAGGMGRWGKRRDMVGGREATTMLGKGRGTVGITTGNGGMHGDVV